VSGRVDENCGKMATTVKTISEVLAKCRRVFETKAFRQNERYGVRESRMCTLYDCLVSEDNAHSSLGCNLADAAEDILSFLSARTDHESSKLESACRDYLIKLYFLAERVYEVLDVIKLLTDENRSATEGLRTIRDVKQWGNFFKHPGGFLWCHHAEYHCESLGPPPPASENTIEINQEFVNTYYTSDSKKHLECHKKLSNSKGVRVVFPDLIQLTHGFCQGLDDFVDTVASPMFSDRLRRKATLNDYFDRLDTEFKNASD
jgi:hypothetical protein